MSTALSSSVPGLSPTSLTSVSSALARNLGLSELTYELTRRLTELENLGLLSDYGKNLMSSLVLRGTPTLSTDGSAQARTSSCTCTSRQASGKRASGEDWWKFSQGNVTAYQSPGPISLADMNALLTHG